MSLHYSDLTICNQPLFISGGVQSIVVFGLRVIFLFARFIFVRMFNNRRKSQSPVSHDVFSKMDVVYNFLFGYLT